MGRAIPNFTMKNPIIVDDDISLQPPSDRLAAAVFGIVDTQREYLREWLPWVDKTTSVNYIRTFLRESSLFNRGGQRLTTFIFYQRQLVGSISFVRINKEHQRGEVGYWLHRDFQGRGIITRSCAAIIDYGFRQLNLQRVEIRILVGNDRSRKIPGRVGCQHEGRLRRQVKLYNDFYDVDLFAIIRPDWERQRWVS